MASEVARVAALRTLGALLQPQPQPASTKGSAPSPKGAAPSKQRASPAAGAHAPRVGAAAPSKAAPSDAFGVAFAKLHGWDLASRMLIRHHASPLVCCALLDLASGGRCSPQSNAYGADGGRHAAHTLLVHPSALMLLLEVLAGCGQFSQQQQFLAELEVRSK